MKNCKIVGIDFNLIKKKILSNVKIYKFFSKKYLYCYDKTNKIFSKINRFTLTCYYDEDGSKSSSDFEFYCEYSKNNMDTEYLLISYVVDAKRKFFYEDSSYLHNCDVIIFNDKEKLKKALLLQ